MPQVFSEPEALFVKLILIALLVFALGFVTIASWRMSYQVDVDAMPTQPIAFSHKHHVGDDGLDCRYCHTSVEKSSFAGMPSTKICLTCHSQLFKDAPALAPLHDSARTGKPIAWTRVYDLPDFAYFDHSIHVQKGVACIECHGRVDQMPITRRVAPLTMEWCLACHRGPDAHLHKPDRVFAMEPPESRDPAQTSALVRFYHLQSTRRLTDCSTCHR
ncbi:MAG: cytochrome c3 family protein [Burkholderiales bacterium]